MWRSRGRGHETWNYRFPAQKKLTRPSAQKKEGINGFPDGAKNPPEPKDIPRSRYTATSQLLLEHGSCDTDRSKRKRSEFAKVRRQKKKQNEIQRRTPRCVTITKARRKKEGPPLQKGCQCYSMTKAAKVHWEGGGLKRKGGLQFWGKGLQGGSLPGGNLIEKKKKFPRPGHTNSIKGTAITFIKKKGTSERERSRARTLLE